MIGYIIALIIIIGIIGAICSAIKDLYDNLSDAISPTAVIITIILSIIAFFAFSWVGVLAVAILGLGFSFTLKKIGQALAQHDKSRRETAKINQKTKKMSLDHSNEMALREELEKNCRWLGYMNQEKWKDKLSNYVNKSYETDFESITNNFAKQMEEQNIIQNGDWFKPFLQHIVDTEAGNTAIQLLNVVNCPQLNITHITPDIELLESELEKKTQRISDDVPPLLNKVSGGIYIPTKYAIKLYGKKSNINNVVQHEVIELDD